MGSMTRSQIITEGLQLAGNSGLGVRAVAWLQTWLDRVYQSYPWPFLKGDMEVVLTPGAGILNVNDPAVLRISDVTGVNLLSDGGEFLRTLNVHRAVRPGYLTGTLYNAIYAPSALDPYVATLTVGTNTQIPYRLGVTYQFLPLALEPADRPLYPNDETCIQAVHAMALRHQKDGRADVEAMGLARMVAEDRVSAVHKRGGADRLGLSSRFRQRG